MMKIKVYFNYVKQKINNIFLTIFYLEKGYNTYISKTAQLFGVRNMSFGNNCIIGDDSILTVNNRIQNIKQLRIYDNVYIGRNNFISVGGSISIGSYCIFGNNCSIICSDHNFNDPFVPYSLSGATFTKHINIGVNCWLGNNVTIIGNVNIGHGTVIGANTLVTKDIPPFSIVVGNPAYILKKYNTITNKWESNLNECPEPNISEIEYLNILSSKFKNINLSIHAASKKFGNL